MLVVFMVNAAIAALTVLIHYEFLSALSTLISRMKLPIRSSMMIGVFGTLMAHCIEVWVFAVAYYAKINTEGWGTLTGRFDGSLMDCAYFSFTTYTTVGFGDIEPIGNLRFLTGIESLTGLVLITWTASFLFIEMQRHWDK